MLDDVSHNEEDRRRLLGDEYEDFCKWIQGVSLQEAQELGYNIPPSPSPSPLPPSQPPESAEIAEPEGPRRSKRRRVARDSDNYA